MKDAKTRDTTMGNAYDSKSNFQDSNEYDVLKTIKPDSHENEPLTKVAGQSFTSSMPNNRQ